MYLHEPKNRVATATAKVKKPKNGRQINRMAQMELPRYQILIAWKIAFTWKARKL